jgi:hypothetical protein
MNCEQVMLLLVPSNKDIIAVTWALTVPMSPRYYFKKEFPGG